LSLLSDKANNLTQKLSEWATLFVYAWSH